MTLAKSITFFYPSKIVGGAEFLFIRMAKYIADATLIKVYVVDYKDGFLRKQLQQTKVNIIDYSDSEILKIQYKTTIITSFNHLFKILEFDSGQYDVRLLLWSIHPTHFTNYFLTRKWFTSSLIKSRIGNNFKKLINSNSMVFMDYPNYIENAKVLKFSLDRIPYLPVPCYSYDGYVKKYFKQSEITICWLGRIANDKVNSILNLLLHINLLPEDLKKRINLIIIGTGEEDELLNTHLAKMNIRYERKGTLINEELNSYLINHVDIGFAMGTSVLEFAKLKIPVVLVDVFENEIPNDNHFQWLFESTGFSLGSYYSDETERKHTLLEIITIVNDITQYNNIAHLCFDYYEANHKLENIVKKLLGFLDGQQLSYNDQSVKEINRFMNPWIFLVLKRIWGQFIKIKN